MAEAAGDSARPAAADSSVVLSCSELSFSYLDRYPALEDVSFDVHRGETVGLLGANGSGKSTLLKLLDGLLFPDSGSYRAFGEEITEDALEDEQLSTGFRGRVGFVFQNSDAQVFSPTVREEVAFGPLQLGLDRAEVTRRVDDVLAMLGITALDDRAPFQLSGGQKKKVAIASVLSMNPEVLLFDEPTAALDPRTQRWLIDLLGDLTGAGKTIVLATHDLALAAELCSRCLVFSEDHRVVLDGPTDRMLSERARLVAVNLLDPLDEPNPVQPFHRSGSGDPQDDIRPSTTPDHRRPRPARGISRPDPQTPLPRSGVSGAAAPSRIEQRRSGQSRSEYRSLSGEPGLRPVS